MPADAPLGGALAQFARLAPGTVEAGWRWSGSTWRSEGSAAVEPSLVAWLVGNSGALRLSRFGPAIDSHDVVVRLNQAPVQGYERRVGRRTTHRVLNRLWTRTYRNGCTRSGVGGGGGRGPDCDPCGLPVTPLHPAQAAWLHARERARRRGGSRAADAP